MLQAFDKRAQLAREAADRLTREMAEERGISMGAMRAQLCYYRVPSLRYTQQTQRRDNVVRLWQKRGSTREKARYLDLSIGHLKRLAARWGLRPGTLQLALWPRAFHKRKRARSSKPCNTCTLFCQPDVQFTLFDPKKYAA